MCSGRPLKKETTIAGIVGPLRMTHHPSVGVIYLRAKSKWSNMFYTVQILIYNKWLQDEEQINDSVIHIWRGMRNGRMERVRKRAIVCVGRKCI